MLFLLSNHKTILFQNKLKLVLKKKTIKARRNVGDKL